MVYLSPTLNIINKTIRNVGKKLIRDFNEIEKIQSSINGTQSFADNTFQKIKKNLIFLLNEIKPEYKIIFLNDTEYVNFDDQNAWIVNPIDGFINFVHGIPHFSISIALKENSEISSASIYDPIKDEIFFAFKGKGSYLNDFRIRVSQRIETNSILSFNGKNKEKIKNLFLEKFSIYRQSGCASLDICYLAAGRNEVFFDNLENKPNFLASILILKEAGGLISDEKKIFIASNIACKAIIKEIVNKI